MHVIIIDKSCLFDKAMVKYKGCTKGNLHLTKNTKCGLKTGDIPVFVMYICTHYRVCYSKLTDPITGNKTTNKDMVKRVVGDLLLYYYSVYIITN